MSLRHMVRVGRHWLNPRYLVRVEDLSCPDTPRDGAAGDSLVVVMQRGENLSLTGDDAAEMRQLLGEAESARAKAASSPPAGRTVSGHGPGARLAPDDPEIRSVPE